MIQLISNACTVLLYVFLYSHTIFSLLLSLVVSYCAPRFVLSWVTTFWARGIFILMGTRLRVIGRENIPTTNRYMILTNHASLFDIPAIMAVFPNISWLGREYLTRIPVLGHMLKRTNYVAIGRNPAMNVRLIIQKSIMNSERFSIALFPEGTRTVTGQLQDFKRGFIHIMNGGDLDILPVVMNGLFRIKPKTRFSIIPFQTVEIIICKPIKRVSLTNLPNEEIIRRIRNVFVYHYNQN